MQELDEKGKLSVQNDYVRPEAAWKLLKSAKVDRRTVYISGASGFGKTSLVADFLSRRRYMYCSAEKLLDMEQELSKLMEKDYPEKEMIVVLDDLHLLETREVRERYFEKIRCLSVNPLIWLILISRAPVPGWLKPVYIDNLFLLIGERELGLNTEETEGLFEYWHIDLPSETIGRLSGEMKGHPLYLRCVAIQLGRMEENLKTGQEEALRKALEDVFDYIGVHVFDQWNQELHDFLMDLSIVKCFDMEMARIITKRSDVEVMLLQAKETGTFLYEEYEQERTWYQFRKMMQKSMLRRLLNKTSHTHVMELYNSAGTAYEIKGDVISALEMYEKAGNKDGIYRLLIANARKCAGAGHYWELRRYYLGMDEKLISTSPELMAGMSLLQSIMLDDEESERWYEELENHTKKQSGRAKQVAQEKLLYLDIALPHRGTVRMIDLLKTAGNFLSGKGFLMELSLTNSQPSMMNGGKDFCEWSRRDKELAKSIGKLVELVLGRFGKGLVNLALAESCYEKGADSYEVAAYADKGRLQAESGGKLEQVFVAIGILSRLALLNGRSEDAIEMVESFRQTAGQDAPHLLENIDTLMLRFSLYVGRYDEITGWMEAAPNENMEFCTLERYRYMAKARGYLATGKREKALSLLQRMKAYAEKRHRIYIQIEAGVLLAITQYRLGNEQWQENLQKAITQAESYHFVRVLSEEGAALEELFEEREFIWNDRKYKEQVLAECRRQAECYPKYLSEHKNDIGLSDMAIKILKMMEKGLTINEIADKLSITPSGVKYYNTETYKKMGVKGKTEALAEARNRKLI